MVAATFDAVRRDGGPHEEARAAATTPLTARNVRAAELFAGSSVMRTVPGCAPAWRPDGVLTVAHRDAIVRPRPDGSQVSLPEYLRDARDFAWSPDERLLALAGPYAVTVVDVSSLERYDRTGGGLQSVTILQPAARFDWS